MVSRFSFNTKYSKTVTLRIPKELDEIIDKISRELGYNSKSDFVRDAISEYIDYLISMMDSSSEENYESIEDITEIKYAKVIMV